jgi:hypothetical protein
MISRSRSLNTIWTESESSFFFLSWAGDLATAVSTIINMLRQKPVITGIQSVPLLEELSSLMHTSSSGKIPALAPWKQVRPEHEQ